MARNSRHISIDNARGGDRRVYPVIILPEEVWNTAMKTLPTRAQQAMAAAGDGTQWQNPPGREIGAQPVPTTVAGASGDAGQSDHPLPMTNQEIVLEENFWKEWHATNDRVHQSSMTSILDSFAQHDWRHLLDQGQFREGQYHQFMSRNRKTGERTEEFLQLCEATIEIIASTQNSPDAQDIGIFTVHPVCMSENARSWWAETMLISKLAAELTGFRNEAIAAQNMINDSPGQSMKTIHTHGISTHKQVLFMVIMKN